MYYDLCDGTACVCVCLSHTHTLHSYTHYRRIIARLSCRLRAHNVINKSIIDLMHKHRKNNANTQRESEKKNNAKINEHSHIKTEATRLICTELNIHISHGWIMHFVCFLSLLLLFFFVICVQTVETVCRWAANKNNSQSIKNLNINWQATYLKMVLVLVLVLWLGLCDDALVNGISKYSKRYAVEVGKD